MLTNYEIDAPELRGRIVQAFKALKKQGFLVYTNLTMGEYSKLMKKAEHLEKCSVTVRGLIWFTNKDTKSFNTIGALGIRFMEYRSVHTLGILSQREVGVILKRELEKVGLDVGWNGNPTSPVVVKGSNWKYEEPVKEKFKRKIRMNNDIF